MNEQELERSAQAADAAREPKAPGPPSCCPASLLCAGSHGLLTDGVAVEYKDPNTGETRGGRAKLIDFDNPDNDFLVVRQLAIAAANGNTIRPDLVLYVNGLPLVVIEMKDPANTAADLNVASDGLLTRVGSVTSGPRRCDSVARVAGCGDRLQSRRESRDF